MRKELRVLDLLAFSEKKRQLLMNDLTSDEYLLINMILFGYDRNTIKSKFYGEYDSLMRSALEKINESHEFYMNYNDSTNNLIVKYGGKDVLEANLAELSAIEQTIIVYLYDVEGDFTGNMEKLAKTLKLKVSDVVTLYNSAVRRLNLYIN